MWILKRRPGASRKLNYRDFMEPNLTNFSDFLRSLRKTNASLSYFTDFNKCGENLKAVSIKLHTLDFLLGSKDLKTDTFKPKLVVKNSL